MSAPLTWRNVDAADASVAMRGYKQFSDLLGQAFSGAADSLGQFKDQRAEAADQAAFAESLKYTDPAAYQAALQSGQIPQGNMSAAGTQELGQRTTQLLGQALGSQRLKLGDQELVTNEIGQRQAEQDIRTGEVNLQQNQRTLDYMPNVEARAELESQDRSNANQFDLNVNRYTQGRRVRDDGRTDQTYADDQSAITNFRIIQDAPDATAARELLYSLRDKVTPATWDKLRSATDAKFKTESLSAQTGQLDSMGNVIPGTQVSLSAPGTQGTNKGSSWDAVIGGVVSPVPVSTMPMGDVLKYGQDVLIPGNRGKYGNSPDKGSSAVGAFQITGGTLKEYGPKVLGSDWETKPFSAENQDKLAEAIFNDRKNGNLKDTWQGLANTTPGFYKDVPWSEMRQNISSVESASANGQPLEQVTAAQARATELLGKQKIDSKEFLSGAASAVVKNQGNQDDPFKVANDFATKIGGDKDKILDQIRTVQESTGTNAATAAALIEKSLVRANWAARNIVSTGTDNVSDDQVIDQTALDKYVNALKSGDTFSQAMSIEQNGAGLATSTSLLAAAKAANVKLAEASARAQRGDPGYAEALPRIQAEASKANELLNLALASENRRQ